MKRGPRYKWQPLRRAVAKPISEQLIAEHMRLKSMGDDTTREKIIASLTDEVDNVQLWLNDNYQVAVRDLGDSIVHLNIRRRDGGPVLRDWRHFQQIKNELLGEECEAVELYPAESRKVDTSNKYHLIGVSDPTFRFPFGDLFGNKRDVTYEGGDSPGTRQRPE
jgi:hypothetical protein